MRQLLNAGAGVAAVHSSDGLTALHATQEGHTATQWRLDFPAPGLALWSLNSCEPASSLTALLDAHAGATTADIVGTNQLYFAAARGHAAAAKLLAANTPAAATTALSRAACAAASAEGHHQAAAAVFSALAGRDQAAAAAAMPQLRPRAVVAGHWLFGAALAHPAQAGLPVGRPPEHQLMMQQVLVAAVTPVMEGGVGGVGGSVGLEVSRRMRRLEVQLV